MIYIAFAIFMTALATLVIGGICHGASVADREWERLEREDGKI